MLTADDRITLVAHLWGQPVQPDAWQLGRNIEPVVEKIIDRHVTTALNAAADALRLRALCTVDIKRRAAYRQAANDVRTHRPRS